MALIDQYTLSQDTTYRNRVAVAVYTAMGDVAQEATTGVTADDIKRYTLAVNYINDVDSLRALILENFIQLSVTNATIAATAPTGTTATDSDIQFVVNSFVNTVAGVNTANPNV